MSTAALSVTAPNRKLDVLQQLKEMVAHPYHRILFSNTKEWTTETCNMDEAPGNYAEGGKKSISKSYT